MTLLDLLSPLEARDDDTERFAKELAKDLEGGRVEVVWAMSSDDVYLARRIEEDGEGLE